MPAYSLFLSTSPTGHEPYCRITCCHIPPNRVGIDRIELRAKGLNCQKKTRATSNANGNIWTYKRSQSSATRGFVVRIEQRDARRWSLKPEVLRHAVDCVGRETQLAKLGELTPYDVRRHSAVEIARRVLVFEVDRFRIVVAAEQQVGMRTVDIDPAL